MASRLIWQLNLFLTGADISPACQLGPGLVIIHPVAATICGNAGSGLTIVGHGGLGGGRGRADIGAGAGLPVLGNNVWLERGASVLGPVRVGDDVVIGPGCTVVRDLASGTNVDAHEIRVRRALPRADGCKHDGM